MTILKKFWNVHNFLVCFKKIYKLGLSSKSHNNAYLMSLRYFWSMFPIIFSFLVENQKAFIKSRGINNHMFLNKTVDGGNLLCERLCNDNVRRGQIDAPSTDQHDKVMFCLYDDRLKSWSLMTTMIQRGINYWGFHCVTNPFYYSCSRWIETLSY